MSEGTGWFGLMQAHQLLGNCAQVMAQYLRHMWWIMGDCEPRNSSITPWRPDSADRRCVGVWMNIHAAYGQNDQHIAQMIYSCQPGMYLVRYVQLCRRMDLWNLDGKILIRVGAILSDSSELTTSTCPYKPMWSSGRGDVLHHLCHHVQL